jgi:glutamine amidotransferase
MKTVAVIDYGMSNLRSVSKALEHVAGQEWQVVVTADANTVLHADKVVFPGQGAIGNCMLLLEQTGLKAVIQQAFMTKPFLGICLGLQSLLTLSEESGGTPCFDFVRGTVRRFPEPLFSPENGEHLKVPHMGWNQVYFAQPHVLWTDIPEQSRFYFVHSYYADPAEITAIAATTPYGGIHFTSAIAHDNVFAVQFHPEKSQHHGLHLLRNFLNW